MDITPEIQAEIDAAVAAATRDIKGKLDAAFEERDNAAAALKKAETDLAAIKRNTDLELLKAREDGRTAGEKKLAAALERIEALETHNTTLAKDKAVNDALSGYAFRTSTAQTMAHELISGNLLKNDKGEWVASDGRAPATYVKEILESDEYSFLLKPAVSSGAGTNPGKGTSGDDGSGLLDKSNADILKRYMR